MLTMTFKLFNKNPKALLIFLTIISSVISARVAYANAKLKGDLYECKGVYKTMLFQLPMDLKIEGNLITWKLWFQKKEKYVLDVKYPNGVLIQKIDNLKYSVKQFNKERTLLLDRCELLFPLESLLIDSIPIIKKYF